MTPWLHRGYSGVQTVATPRQYHRIYIYNVWGLKSENATNLHGSHTEHQDIFTGVNRGQNRESGT